MNYIHHLTGFFERAALDSRLNSTHISMYMSLFQFWNLNRFQNPLSISRSEVMKVSKISAIGTYHKCVKELHAFGYLIYEPSYNPYKGSIVRMLPFTPDKTTASHSYKNETSAEQETASSHSATALPLEPYTNNNKLNKQHKQIEVHAPEIITESKFGKPEKEKSCAKKEKSHAALFSPGSQIPPSAAEVQMYFKEREQPHSEADRFFNHYEANGWLVGGRSKMKNWHAAARNWALNSQRFANPAANSAAGTAGHLNATTGKSYQDKL